MSRTTAAITRYPTRRATFAGPLVGFPYFLTISLTGGALSANPHVAIPCASRVLGFAWAVSDDGGASAIALSNVGIRDSIGAAGGDVDILNGATLDLAATPSGVAWQNDTTATNYVQLLSGNAVGENTDPEIESYDGTGTGSFLRANFTASGPATDPRVHVTYFMWATDHVFSRTSFGDAGVRYD